MRKRPKTRIVFLVTWKRQHVVIPDDSNSGIVGLFEAQRDAEDKMIERLKMLGTNEYEIQPLVLQKRRKR